MALGIVGVVVIAATVDLWNCLKMDILHVFMVVDSLVGVVVG